MALDSGREHLFSASCVASRVKFLFFARIAVESGIRVRVWDADCSQIVMIDSSMHAGNAPSRYKSGNGFWFV